MATSTKLVAKRIEYCAIRQSTSPMIPYSLPSLVFRHNKMIFLNTGIQSKSSIKEPDDFASDMSFSALLMCEDALGGREHQLSELSRRQDVIGPLLEIADEDVVARANHPALVNAADELDDNLLAAVVVDYLELADVVVLLHDLQELQQDFGAGLDQHLLLAFAFSIYDRLQGVS